MRSLKPLPKEFYSIAIGLLTMMLRFLPIFHLSTLRDTVILKIIGT